MTVAELIDKLQQLDQDRTVVCEFSEWDQFNEIDDIREIELLEKKGEYWIPGSFNAPKLGIAKMYYYLNFRGEWADGKIV